MMRPLRQNSPEDQLCALSPPKAPYDVIEDRWIAPGTSRSSVE